MKILIIEDQQDIAMQLKDYLEECGYILYIASTGEEGLFEGAQQQYDCILLDLGLPDMDGLTLLRELRNVGQSIPIIILTARTGKMDIVQGLEAGADDYIKKPFDLDEVSARIKSNIRRHTGQLSDQLQYHNIILDTSKRRVMKGGKFIKLTRIEFLLLEYLFMHQGTPISINELTDHAYADFDNDSGIIPKHIANIRKKIGHEIILTESNRGYYIPHETS